MSIAPVIKLSRPLDPDVYVRVFRDLPDEVQLIDPRTFRVLAANGDAQQEGGCVDLGLHCTQHRGGRHQECKPPNHQCPIQRCLHTRETAVVEQRHVDADGIVTYHEAVVSPVFDAAGGIEYLLHMTRDVTEQVMLRNKIIEAERVRNLTILARFFGHQFLNKLGGIVQIGRMIAEDPGSAQTREFLPMIAQGAEELSRHARRLLDLSRPASEELEYLKPNDQLQEIIDELQRYGLLDKMTIALSLSDEVGMVLMVRDELAEIIRNITINAWHAMQETPRRELTITTRRTDEAMVELVFADSGPGIPEEILETVAQPFVTTKPPGKGSGLGLSIVKSLAQKYGGYLQLTSRTDLGTTVVIGIPLCENV